LTHLLRSLGKLATKMLLYRSGWSLPYLGANLVQVHEQPALDLILLLELVLVKPELISSELAGSMVPMLMAVGAEHNEIIWVVASSFCLLHDVMNLEALLSADRATVPGLHEQLVSDGLGNGHAGEYVGE